MPANSESPAKSAENVADTLVSKTKTYEQVIEHIGRLLDDPIGGLSLHRAAKLIGLFAYLGADLGRASGKQALRVALALGAGLTLDQDPLELGQDRCGQRLVLDRVPIAERLKETVSTSRVTRGALRFAEEEDRIPVAIGEDLANDEEIATLLPFHPGFLPRTTEKRGLPGSKRRVQALSIHPSHHADFPGQPILRNGRDQPGRVKSEVVPLNAHDPPLIVGSRSAVQAIFPQ